MPENILQTSVRVEVADSHAHPRLFPAVLIQRHAAFETPLSEGSVAIVAQQQTRRSIAGNVDIPLSAIPVEVGRNGCQRIAWLNGRHAGCVAHIRKCPVSVVVVKPARLLRKAAWPAVNRNIPPLAIRRFPASWNLIRIEYQVVRDKQIQQPIAIVIDPRAAG